MKRGCFGGSAKSGCGIVMVMELGTLRSWHHPHNDDCQHNHDIGKDCNCKKQRKPYRVIRVHAKGVNHNVNPEIIVEVHPQGGHLVLREARRSRKSAVTFTIAQLYSQGVRARALQAIAERQRAKRERSKVRKLAKKLERAQAE